MLSACIATAGIVSDSTATVIGAMIVAPLPIPIQGTAVAIAYGELRPLLRSAGIVVSATAVVVAIGALLAFLLPQLSDPSDNAQITGRVSPTIVDLVAAATTGRAGALAVGRRDIGDILPGVAIAISLVPPLAVVGVTAVDGDWDGALGATLLFLTNALAIVVVGTLLFSALRIRKGGADPIPRSAAGPCTRSSPLRRSSSSPDCRWRPTAHWSSRTGARRRRASARRGRVTTMKGSCWRGSTATRSCSSSKVSRTAPKIASCRISCAASSRPPPPSW